MSEFLAEAKVLIRPDTTAFRATLAAELKTATEGLTVPVPVVAVGAGGTAAVTRQAQVGAAAQGELAAATNVTAAAQEKAAVSAAAEGAAVARSTPALLASARAHEQLGRGAGASALALGGIRGATLAASGPFLIGAAAVTIFAKSLREASDEEEAQARASRVLGTALEGRLLGSAKSLADQFGISAVAGLKFEAVIAETLKNLGFGSKRVAELSAEFVKLARDMATANNVPIETTLRAIQLAVGGNLRALRQFGVTIRQTDVAQEALTETGKKQAKALTANELATARINLVLRQTADVAGAFADSQDRAATQAQILRANLANLEAEIGGAVLPGVSAFLSVTNRLVTGLKELASIKIHLPGGGGDSESHQSLNFFQRLSKELSDDLTTAATRPLGEFQVLKRLLDATSASADHTTSALGSLAHLLDVVRGSALSDVGPFTELNNAIAQLLRTQLRQAQGKAAGIEEGLVRIKISGGNEQQQIAQLQKDIRQQEVIVRLSGTSVASRRAAEQQILSDQQEIKSINDGIAAAAQQAASAAEAAANKARQARAAADQAIQDAFGLGDSQQQLLITIAQGTKGLQDDIKAEQNYIVFLQREMLVIAKRIQDELLKRQILAQLRLTIAQTENTVKELQQQEADLRAAQKKAALERQEQILDLRIEIAQARGDVAGEIRAREARVRELKARIKAAKGDILLINQLTLALVEQQAALKKLRDEQKKRNEDAKKLQFEFLQAQAGFAANLLGNLIPTGAAAGTVGGRTAPGRGFTLPPPTIRPGSVSGGGGGGTIDTVPLGGDRQLRADLTTTSGVAAGRPGPASSSQMATLIELMRHLVRLVAQQNSRTRAPESHAHNSRQLSVMDYQGSH